MNRYTMRVAFTASRPLTADELVALEHAVAVQVEEPAGLNDERRADYSTRDLAVATEWEPSKRPRITWRDPDGHGDSGEVLDIFPTAGLVDVDGWTTELVAEDAPAFLVIGDEGGPWLVPASWLVPTRTEQATAHFVQEETGQ